MEYGVKMCAPGDNDYVPWNKIQADDDAAAVKTFDEKYKHTVTHQFALEKDSKIIRTSYEQPRQ